MSCGKARSSRGSMTARTSARDRRAQRLDRGRGASSRRRRHEQSTVEQMIDQRHEKERVAVTAIEQKGQQIARQASAGKADGEVAGDVRSGQAGEQDLVAQLLAHQLALDRGDRMPAHDRVGRPHVHRTRRRAGPRRWARRGQEVDGRVVAPLEVFDHQHERDLGGERVDAGRSWCNVCAGVLGAAAATPGGRSPSTPRSQSGACRARTASTRSFSGRDRARRRPRGWAGRAPSPYWSMHWPRPTSGRGRCASAVLDGAVDERRLPDARVARDEDDAASTAGCAEERVGDLRALAITSDHDGRRRRVVARDRRGIHRRGVRRGDEAVAPSRHRFDEAGEARSSASARRSSRIESRTTSSVTETSPRRRSVARSC